MSTGPHFKGMIFNVYTDLFKVIGKLLGYVLKQHTLLLLSTHHA